MQSITSLLSLAQRDCVSIIGSGGKTSLLWLLANSFPREKIMVSTTTKIEFSPSLPYDYFYPEPDFREFRPADKGIYLIGSLVQSASKLTAPPENALRQLVPLFDKVLLEADGSKHLPLKGWAQYEPVVPAYTTVTVGIIPAVPAGQLASDKIIHRLPLFSELTGIQPGEPITTAHLAAAACHPLGLMKNAVGRKILLINQVDTPESAAKAEELTAHLPKAFLNTLSCVIACSIQRRQGEFLWKNQ
jgi:probable selenium-dependent hydroxylase accessory protein YqeC